MIFLEILVPNSKSLFLCSAYRPPSAPVSWVECLANELDKIPSSHNPETILCGDFNIDYLKGPPRYWQNALKQFDFTQDIVKPTRILWNHYISWGLNFRGFGGYHQPRIYIPNEY